MACILPDIIGILFGWQLLKSSISVIVTGEIENRAVFGYVTVIQKIKTTSTFSERVKTELSSGEGASLHF